MYGTIQFDYVRLCRVPQSVLPFIIRGLCTLAGTLTLLTAPQSGTSRSPLAPLITTHARVPMRHNPTAQLTMKICPAGAASEDARA